MKNGKSEVRRAEYVFEKGPKLTLILGTLFTDMI